MEQTLYKYIHRYSWRQQVILLVMTAASFPFLYASLELPKIIINQAIAAGDFPKEIHGFEFEQIQYLAVLCGLFLLLVGANGAFKYFINVYKGQVGERMLRRLRYQLFTQTLRFPIPHFRRTSQGEVIAMITSEVEPLGGFIGDALAQPAFQGGTLLTILTFMFAQDVVLGLAAIALYPLQMYVIPKLQRQVNALAKQRVRTVRRLAERIGEGIASIEEIHAHDTAEWHRADFARWVGNIYDIRLNIYRKKFFIKFLNNFIAQLTPFFFYAIGGYLVIKGSLTFGALVAVLSAYKDLSSPWKELLDWYQQKEDTRVKYDQLIEQFRPQGMLPETLQELVVAPVPRLTGPVIASNLSLEDEAGVKVVDQANFHFEIGDRVALLGNASSGGDAIGKMLARLLQPTSGSVNIGGASLATFPEAVTGRRIAYVGNNVALINGSVRDNLYYGLRNYPLTTLESSDEHEREARQRYVMEATRSGNTTSDPNEEWIDYAAYDLDGPQALLDRALKTLRSVDLETDLFGLGLRGTVDAGTHLALAERILAARRLLRERLNDPRCRGLVEVFDRDLYNKNMSVAENLLFGLPLDDTFDVERLSDHPYVQEVLEKVGLRGELVAVGLRMAKIMLDLLGDLAPGHEFFERFSFIAADDLPEYRAIIRRVEDAGLAGAAPADRNALSSLPFRAIPARHRLGLFDDVMERRLLQARRLFAQDLPADLEGSVAFFDAEAYNPAASVQDNILFGKLVYGRQLAQRQVGAMIAEVIDELGLRADVVDLGLDFGVGIGGSRLTTAQRQKLAIARALLKRPDMLIMDNAMASIDSVGQAQLQATMFEHGAAHGLVSVTGDSRHAAAFDYVIVLEAGRVVDQGTATAVLARQAAIEDERATNDVRESESLGGL